MKVSRIFEFFQYQKKHFPQQKAFGYKPKDKWVYFSIDEIMEKANQVSKSTSNLDALNDIANQDTKKIVKQSGVYLIGAIEPYNFQGQSGESAFIQLATFNSSDSKRMSVTTIKVEESQRGVIDILNKNRALTPVTLQCEIRMFGKRSETFLTEKQPDIKIA